MGHFNERPHGCLLEGLTSSSSSSLGVDEVTLCWRPVPVPVSPVGAPSALTLMAFHHPPVPTFSFSLSQLRADALAPALTYVLSAGTLHTPHGLLNRRWRRLSLSPALAACLAPFPVRDGRRPLGPDQSFQQVHCCLACLEEKRTQPPPSLLTIACSSTLSLLCAQSSTTGLPPLSLRHRPLPFLFSCSVGALSRTEIRMTMFLNSIFLLLNF